MVASKKPSAAPPSEHAQGIPLELVRYSVEDGKFYVGKAALEALKKVELRCEREILSIRPPSSFQLALFLSPAVHTARSLCVQPHACTYAPTGACSSRRRGGVRSRQAGQELHPQQVGGRVGAREILPCFMICDVHSIPTTSSSLAPRLLKTATSGKGKGFVVGGGGVDCSPRL